MVRHVITHRIKFGHWNDYVASAKAWNKEAVRVGLPAYRVYHSAFGVVNEAFEEADFKDAGDIEARWAAAGKDAAFRKITTESGVHLVDGESRAYVLTEQ
jgi:hypothetical protein